MCNYCTRFLEYFFYQDDIQSVACDWLLPYLKPPPAVIHATKKCIMGNVKPLEKTLELERYTVLAQLPSTQNANDHSGLRVTILGFSINALFYFLIFRSIFKTVWSGEHNLKALEKNLKHNK